MSWLENINGKVQVGEIITVPDLVRAFKPESTWQNSGLRSCIYNQLLKASKYGLYEKLGIDENGNRLWRRLK